MLAMLSLGQTTRVGESLGGKKGIQGWLEQWEAASKQDLGPHSRVVQESRKKRCKFISYLSLLVWLPRVLTSPRCPIL